MYQAEEERQQTVLKSGFLIFPAPFFFLTRPGDVIEKSLFCNSRDAFLDLVLFGLPRHFGCGRYRFAYAVSISSHGKIEVRKDGLQLQGVGLLKGFIEKRLGNFKSNEITI